MAKDAEKHCIVILACYIVGLNEGVGTKVGAAVLTQCADYDRGHREIQTCLIEIVHDSKVFKTTHCFYSFVFYFFNFIFSGKSE